MSKQNFKNDTEAMLEMADGNISAYRFLFDHHFPDLCNFLMIYQLAWEENISHKKIAGQLGVTLKTVENHVGIALRKLRESLKPYYKQIFMIWEVQFSLD